MIGEWKSVCTDAISPLVVSNTCQFILLVTDPYRSRSKYLTEIPKICFPKLRPPRPHLVREFLFTLAQHYRSKTSVVVFCVDIYTYTGTYIHTYIHTRTYIHAYIHTRYNITHLQTSTFHQIALTLWNTISKDWFL